MYLLVSHEINELFLKNMSFANETRDDTPLYKNSICVIKTDFSIVDGIAKLKNDLVIEGFLPYANIFVSNSSEHKILRGQKVDESVMVLGVENYKVDSSWKHKALFCFNKNCLNDKSFLLYEKGDRVFFTNKVKKLVSKGMYRNMRCRVINPLWKEKQFYGINIHRGPIRNESHWNFSLGCTTVEATQFDIFMNELKFDECAICIHDIESILRSEMKREEIKNFFGGTINIDDLYRQINSAINVLGGKDA